MIKRERLNTYINSLDSENPAFLMELEEEAQRNYVPVIRTETQNLLKLLLAMNRPKRILEVGTAVGFSALLMEYFNPADCKITTIENYQKRIPIAQENFRKAGKCQVIELLEGDAAQVLKTLTEPYDFIFMDAAKGQYIHFLKDVMRLLEPGGVLVSDNVLQEGDIIEESILTRQEQSAQSQQSIASQASSAGEMDAYMKHVYEVIAKHYALTQRLKRYKQGEVKLAFKIDMSGVVFDIQVISSSGYAEIDNAAVKTLQGISKDLKKPNKIYTMSITLHYGNKNK